MSDELRIAPGYQPLMREIGLDAETIFTHPQIIPWRTLPDRENCTLDAQRDGRPIRLHVKRYAAVQGRVTPAEEEVRGHQWLTSAGIPTAPLVGWGKLGGGRSFVLMEDLHGYKPCDKLLEAGHPFDRLLEPTADLAATLHNAGLHHRDLYLCHFMANPDVADPALKLIDTARVRRLPALFMRRRWIVKDLAQFWYSTLSLAVSEQQRDAWLSRYSNARAIADVDSLCRAVQRKVRSIARHDRNLRKAQPTRNISIPE